MKKRVVGLAVGLLAAIGAFAQPYPANVLPGTAGNSAIYYNTRTLGPSGSNSVAMNFYITTNNVDYFTISTNVYITFLTNVLFTQTVNVTGKATFSQFLVVSNGIQSASVAWTGPTNTIPLNSWKQHYSTLVPVSITGFTGKSTTNCQPVVLNLINTSGTNVGLTLNSAGLVSLDYTTSYTMTNGAVVSMEYNPYVAQTNAVVRVW